MDKKAPPAPTHSNHHGADRTAAPGNGHGTTPANGRHLLPVLERLTALLDEETAALRSRKPFDMESFSLRKNQLLLELNRAGGQGGVLQTDEVFQSVLFTTRNALKVNNRALQMHLAALEEIAGILSGVILDAECDGTYSAAMAAERRRV